MISGFLLGIGPLFTLVCGSSSPLWGKKPRDDKRTYQGMGFRSQEVRTYVSSTMTD
jgi:hypothetical protein